MILSLLSFASQVVSGHLAALGAPRRAACDQARARGLCGRREKRCSLTLENAPEYMSDWGTDELATNAALAPYCGRQRGRGRGGGEEEGSVRGP